MSNESNKKVDFLCPKCQYGHLARIVKNEQGIPYDAEYFCLDETKQREKQYESSVPSILDYADGPGGWDPEKGCPNYIQRKEDDGPKYTVTTSHT